MEVSDLHIVSGGGGDGGGGGGGGALPSCNDAKCRNVSLQTTPKSHTHFIISTIFQNSILDFIYSIKLKS